MTIFLLQRKHQYDASRVTGLIEQPKDMMLSLLLQPEK